MGTLRWRPGWIRDGRVPGITGASHHYIMAVGRLRKQAAAVGTLSSRADHWTADDTLSNAVLSVASDTVSFFALNAAGHAINPAPRMGHGS